MSVNLQDLLNAIPTANDGDIVTKEYHNSIRTTLQEIISQLGSQTVTLTFAPNFLQRGSEPTWTPYLGTAYTGEVKAYGWFPLQLPNGSRIQSMSVIGYRNNTAPLQINLLRQPKNSSDTITLIAVPLSTELGSFQVTANLQVPGAGPAATEEYKTVDNYNYKYLVDAKLDQPTSTSTTFTQSTSEVDSLPSPLKDSSPDRKSVPVNAEADPAAQFRAGGHPIVTIFSIQVTYNR